MLTREYTNYKAYIKHQALKGNQILDDYRNHGKFPIRTSVFRSEFAALIEDYDMKSGTILCLGARYGEEVKAWQEFGFTATGIDLNPGKKNKYVVAGDFHDLNWPNESFDYIWSNSMDHALYLDRMLKEAHRVLKKGGLAIFECKQHVKSSVTADKFWEAVFWESQEEIIKFFKDLNIWKEVIYNPLKFFVLRATRKSILDRPCVVCKK